MNLDLLPNRNVLSITAYLMPTSHAPDTLAQLVTVTHQNDLTYGYIKLQNLLGTFDYSSVHLLPSDALPTLRNSNHKSRFAGEVDDYILITAAL